MNDLISKQGWECQNRLVYIKRHVDKRLEAQAAEMERLNQMLANVRLIAEFHPKDRAILKAMGDTE
jgi:hypothetical protein